MDGQIEVANRILGNMLRCLVGNTPNNWDMALAHVEFTYNDSPNRSIVLFPFYIIYGMHPRGVFSLIYLGSLKMRSVDGEEFSRCIHDLHEGFKL
jgi:hypothetical protein